MAYGDILACGDGMALGDRMGPRRPGALRRHYGSRPVAIVWLAATLRAMATPWLVATTGPLAQCQRCHRRAASRDEAMKGRIAAVEARGVTGRRRLETARGDGTG